MTIEELLEQCIQKNLIDLTISGLKKKNEELPVKIKVRPVAMKDKIEYQVSEFIGRKVFHNNYKKDEFKKKITDWMQDGRIVEEGDVISLFQNPQNPYTIQLMEAAGIR